MSKSRKFRHQKARTGVCAYGHVGSSENLHYNASSTHTPPGGRLQSSSIGMTTRLSGLQLSVSTMKYKGPITTVQLPALGAWVLTAVFSWTLVSPLRQNICISAGLRVHEIETGSKETCKFSPDSLIFSSRSNISLCIIWELMSFCTDMSLDCTQAQG